MDLKYGPYSPSRLDTAICGFQFEQDYIDPEGRKRRKENLPQARGSATHEVFEEINKKMCSSENASFDHDEVRNWVTTAVNAHPPAYEEIDAIHKMAKDYIRRPPKLLTKDAQIELKLAIKLVRDEQGAVVTYEDEINGQKVIRPKFEECDYEDKQAFARGRADILLISDCTTKAIIYDHKTQPNIEESDTFQLGFYAWVISMYYPFLQEISTILHFARYATYSEPYVWTRDQLYEVETQVIDRVHSIEARKEWKAVPNSKCQYCNYLIKCPAMAEFIEINEHGNTRVKGDSFKILGDVNRAVKIAGMINVMEEAVSVAKDELRTFVKSFNGSIAIPGKIYEFKGEEEIDWKKVNEKLKGKVYEIFEKHNVDPKMFMGFTQTYSKSIWMAENEELVKDLAALFPRKTTITFKGWKA